VGAAVGAGESVGVATGAAVGRFDGDASEQLARNNAALFI
jgi:hypothetical protein